MNRRTPVVTATLAVTGALAASLTFGAGAAQAAPLAVQQIPAVGTGISGLVVPVKVESRVVAQSTADPMSVRFSAPNGPSQCATTFNKALVRIDWRNPATGRFGTVTIKPCPVGYNPGFGTDASVVTGPGRITFTQVITGSPESATAGLPATPGSGTVLR
ncbi:MULTISPECIES: hypothetical protein [Tsukamurella]|uniref:Uncharacterized protein n=2 Tax=Tsukamurella TaxID=2060 RepID=A0A5C5RZX5_9ACTN|nr:MULTISPECIES: hypothetical protein [Tsukamurella]NMD58258.1 hypothetical protein [Tsukamurella columbiensis]TWS28697.1 hypothetical protein FK530_10855 [Tsukamurella conjunctivitidis]